MQATLPTDERRTGATWVAATGAFLLVAAAAVFIAVQWDRLPEAAKLGLVGALTGAFLLGGRSLRRTLPATGDVLFHLGAFLLPVDLAGIALRLDLGWRPLLLAEGLLVAGVLGGLGIATRSIVLRAAGVFGVAMSAAGIAAVSPLPAPLVLAAVAAVSLQPRLRSRATPLWAALAGLAPLAGTLAVAAVGGGAAGAGVVSDLGVSASAQGYLAMVTGGLAAAVLAAESRARHDVPMALVAVICLVFGVASAWAATELSPRMDVLALAAAFLTVELTALALRRDRFWQPITDASALVVEIVAGAVGGVVSAAAVAFGPLADQLPRSAVSGAAFAVLAAGWLIADVRRMAHPATGGIAIGLLVGGGRKVTTLPMVLAAVASVVAWTASPVAVGAALVAAAAVVVAGNRGGAALIAPASVAWALACASSEPWAAGALGLAGAAILAEAAVARADRDSGTALAVLASMAGLTACAAGADAVGTTAALAGAVAVQWALAAQLERAGRTFGDIARVAALVPVVVAITKDPGDALLVAALAAVASVVEAVRHDAPDLAVGAALCSLVMVFDVGRLSGLDTPSVGLALCVAAVVAAGLAGSVDERWRSPFVVAAGTAAGVGLALASPDQRALSDSLVVVGGLGVGWAVSVRRLALAHVAGSFVVVGIAGHLITAGVTATEPFVLPVAVHLVLAGWHARSRAADGGAVSSWVAYAPAVVLLGSAGLAERVAGGPGWHGLVAGATGAVAVAAGGWRRLAGPLVVGTALVIATTVHESLATLATVPTWAWLAAGGTLLLGTGIALERTGTSPVDAGRRVVDVLADEFG